MIRATLIRNLIVPGIGAVLAARTAVLVAFEGDKCFVKPTDRQWLSGTPGSLERVRTETVDLRFESHDDLYAAIRAAGYPKSGELAARLWVLLSGGGFHRLGHEEAERVYESLGYVPFAGYPLTRKTESRLGVGA